MEVLHDKEKKIFHTIVEGLRCELDYEIIEGKINIFHTFVPEKLRGKGIASILTEAISDYALKNKIKIKPTCSYAVYFYRKNYEKYKEIIDREDLENDGFCRIFNLNK